MIIKPKIKGFLCITAHPEGCREDVRRQIAHVQSRPSYDGPKRVLIIGASGGYGLASRVSLAFGGGASTLGVFFERPAERNRTASPGWYKSAAFTDMAEDAGLYARNINGDAFSDEIKNKTIDVIKKDLGQVDMVVYSLAAPARQLSDGTLVRSTLKPIAQPFEGATLDFNTGEIRSIALEPATEEEIQNTVKVMGGEDWENWIQALLDAGVLADGCVTTNYTYIGTEVTWPIYYHGTIGKAKEDLDRAANALSGTLASVKGKSLVAVMKGLVTQAASAIPGMSIYLSLLFKRMKDKGVHEGCIEQTQRLYETVLFADEIPEVNKDSEGRIRMDELEMADDVQQYVKDHWAGISADNIKEVGDFEGYRDAFLQIHGFGFDNVDYDADVEADVPMDLVE